jgi:hypothetical protein
LVLGRTAVRGLTMLLAMAVPIGIASVEHRALPTLAQPVCHLEHDPEKWEPVFGKRSCSNKMIDHDPDST